LGEAPPTDEAGWLEFAKSLPVRHFYQMARHTEPLSEIATFRFPANQRRHYERLTRFPAGFVVLGDALCAFNPVYGQGMTSAVLQAEALQESLEGQGELWQSFFRLAAQAVETPWQLAAGADAAYLAEAKPSEMGQYLEHLHHAAETDHEVCRAFFEVANLKKPLAHLRSSEVVARVMAASGRGERHHPALPSSPAGA
jgi:2-polyprenyl-6-methoxyphenol hydroxylase-like FAD-dependent oxidoreductase